MQRKKRALIITGRAVGNQSAAAKPFIEAGEPADPFSVGAIHELGMNGSAGGGTPTERDAVVQSFPNPHAAGWKNRKGEFTVVDFDGVDAILKAAAKGALGNSR